jgi:hypothetical protein
MNRPNVLLLRHLHAHPACFATRFAKIGSFLGTTEPLFETTNDLSQPGQLIHRPRPEPQENLTITASPVYLEVLDGGDDLTRREAESSEAHSTAFMVCWQSE